jgi:putative toxin-antitoxin system antitoxin component (TIGR02293 family)
VRRVRNELNFSTKNKAMGKVMTKERKPTSRKKAVVKHTKAKWVVKKLSGAELLTHAVKPMGMAAFKHTVTSSNLTLAMWGDVLNTSTAKLRRRMSQEKTLPAAEAERVHLFAQVYARGVEVFGNEEKFKRWIDLASIALEHRRPRDLMTSAMGLQMVLGELEDIAYGTYA